MARNSRYLSQTSNFARFQQKFVWEATHWSLPPTNRKSIEVKLWKHHECCSKEYTDLTFGLIIIAVIQATAVGRSSATTSSQSIFEGLSKLQWYNTVKEGVDCGTDEVCDARDVGKDGKNDYLGFSWFRYDMYYHDSVCVILSKTTKGGDNHSNWWSVRKEKIRKERMNERNTESKKSRRQEKI